MDRLICVPEDLFNEVLEYFDQRQDASAEGDPLEYKPNEEMVLYANLVRLIGG